MNLDAIVLIDSSVWIEALHPRGRDDCRSLVRTLANAERAATCEVVMLELLRGTPDDEQFEALLDRLWGLEVLSMRGTGAEAARMAKQLRALGHTVPETDLLIAATARLHGVALLHRDRHLALVSQTMGIPELALPEDPR